MRITILAFLSVGVLAVGGCSEPTAVDPPLDPAFSPGAPAGGVAFQAWGMECGDASSVPREVFVSGPVLHIRGLHNENWIYSDNPLAFGWIVVDVDASINQNSGAGRFHGYLELTPNGIDGSWVGNYAGHFRAFGDPRGKFDSRMILHGTGELAGMKMMVDLVVSAALTPPASAPEGCTFPSPYESWSGIILGE